MDLRRRAAAPTLALSFAFAVVMTGMGGALAAGTPGPRTAQADDVIDIAAFDTGFDPDSVSVPAPGTYQVVVENVGAIPHDFTVDGGPSVALDAGAISAPFELQVPDSGLTFYCSITGHREAGMEGRIVVGGSAPTGGLTVDGVDPDPDAPPIRVVDPDAPPPAGDDGTVDVTLTILEQPVTVADGYEVLAWTIDGSVPGPVIRARVGDTVRAQVINDPANSVSHGIEFGAADGPTEQVADLPPGEEGVAVFEVKHAGVYLYGAAGGSAEAIANGLYGLMIVEPASGLAPASAEFALVQGEWYLAGQGQPADAAAAGSAAPAPDLVTFNGVADQYHTAPLRAFAGDRVRFFLADAGPSLASAFHVEGLVFDRVTAEGVELLPGNPSDWGSGTVGLQPGQGAIAEAEVPAAGDYPFYGRILGQAARGAAGILSVDQ